MPTSNTPMRWSSARSLLLTGFALGLFHGAANAQCWQQVAYGFRHSAGIQTGGTLYTWGWNDVGQLGSGGTTPVSEPHQVGSANDWAVVAVSGTFDLELNTGGLHSAAIKADGTLWTWGSNSHGQLGDGTVSDRHLPTQVGTGATWTAVQCGSLHTVALRADGTLWSWGYNGSGQLGLGDQEDVHEPTQVGTDTTWWRVATYADHCLALKMDSSLWSWGRNNYYQLGFFNDNQMKVEPTHVGTDTDWRAIATGTNYSFALKGTNTLWGWGRNDYGQLGVGDNSSYHPVPEQIGIATVWQAVACGDAHTIAQRMDGSLLGWGFNYDGELGVGNNTFFFASPLSLPNGVGSASISLGSNSSASIRTDGSLWAWGRNWEGALGVGDMENHNVPMPVSCGVSTAMDEHTELVVRAFPNPTAGPLLLYRMVEEAWVCDLNGRTVIRVRNTDRLELGALPAGTYMLHMRVGARVAHVRVVTN